MYNNGGTQTADRLQNDEETTREGAPGLGIIVGRRVFSPAQSDTGKTERLEGKGRLGPWKEKHPVVETNKIKSRRKYLLERSES